MPSFTRASAPVRLDFAGGWTDVAPFAVEPGGIVVNAAIGLRAHAEVESCAVGYRIDGGDDQPSQELTRADLASGDGRLALQRAAIRRHAPGPCRLATRSEAPSGSGLGSSAALGVALVAAFDALRAVPREREALAAEAFELEAMEASLPGGKQDQYAAALGGFNRIEFRAGDVRVTPLRLEPAFLESLAAQTVVCYTGVSRVSGRTIERVMGAYRKGDRQVSCALHAMVDIAERMAEALEAGDLAAVGARLTENWERQQQLDPGMRTAEMARLETALGAAGLLGVKAAGAGAGGSMIFLVNDRAAGIEAAEREGARVLPLRWEMTGARVEAVR